MYYYIDLYMKVCSCKLCYIYRWKFIKNFHISVNIFQYRSIYAYIFRSYMFSYIGRYKTITYIGQYKPTSLKSFQYYIYRSIYADKRHISIHICNISWFKLGAYIDAIYVRSYNDRYIKTYILPISTLYVGIARNAIPFFTGLFFNLDF